MIVLLVSVRSTGTRFWENNFKNIGLTKYRLSNTPAGMDLRQGLHVSHCESVHMFHVEPRAVDLPLFLPMRHPMRVAQSWIKRGWELNHMFLAEWHNLFYLQERYNGHWLPIDTDDRDERLRQAGMGLQTDWQPFKVTETDYPHNGGMTLGMVKKYFRNMPFEQFGYEV